MRPNNFILKSLLAWCIIAVLFSCNSSTGTTANKEAKKAGSSAAQTPAPPAEVAFTPFKVMLIKHAVADFEKWKPAFEAHDSVRKVYGQEDFDLLREIDNPNKVLIVEKITDVQKAKDFTVLPNLKEAMQKAGVTGKAEFSYYDVVRMDDSKIDTKDRVTVTHKVKDFDTWLKVYDGEGKATREGEGMKDRVLARGIEDPNIVHLVFAVTDMAKAKTAIGSEAKKNLMTSAGVEGIPVIEFYKKAQ